MLILTRGPGQALVLRTASGEEIRVRVCWYARGKVGIGVLADQSVRIIREEVDVPERRPAPAPAPVIETVQVVEDKPQRTRKGGTS